VSTKLPSLNVEKIHPITDNQEVIFTEFRKGKNLFINGSAGTGKTYVSLYLALNEIFNKPVRDTDRYNITIVRSAVPTRDVGFLPGDLREKMAVYEEPYKAITDTLMNNEGMYDELKKRQYIDFMSTSYVRGLTIDHSVIIVDEVQNMSKMELRSIVTRMGESSRIIFCGDFFQSDLPAGKSGMKEFMDILKRTDDVSFVELLQDDIVRSGFVKRYIMAENEAEGVRAGTFFNQQIAFAQ